MFGPARLGSVSESLAPFLRADIAPARGSEANRLPFYWRRREFTTRDVEHFQREIEQDLRRQTALTHDASKRHGSSDTQTRRQVGRNLCSRGGTSFCC